ncbi:hypothetical protein NO2_0163 [Candidatus Termititenax persephonae]|uniref:Nucleotide-diphospho-sugar transferase n=1 Tax=Candidatus Termititenax persephonae TaxID=2218525 RepID=A0A388TFH9_9BACT|nr:hypothetical protein NO2_0163 [Candidatus Termititenax persephonae]
MFNKPILFLIFNRLNTAKQVFSVIRQVQPKYLYVASDGPRVDKESEKKEVDSVRQYVLANVDWDCEVKTLFRDKNLGCGRAVSSAITWFFEQVEQGIILEDDVLPSKSFFTYCAELLDRYRDDEKIYHIAGCNVLEDVGLKDSYYFALMPGVWGWATWRRAWQKYQYDVDVQSLTEFIKQRKINSVSPRRCDRRHWLNIFKSMQEHKIDTWDYQWVYTVFRSKRGYLKMYIQNHIWQSIMN